MRAYARIMEFVRAIAVGIGDELRAELLEIDENQQRAELSPAQRASAIARRKEVGLSFTLRLIGGIRRPVSRMDARRGRSKVGTLLSRLRSGRAACRRTCRSS